MATSFCLHAFDKQSWTTPEVTQFEVPTKTSKQQYDIEEGDNGKKIYKNASSI